MKTSKTIHAILAFLGVLAIAVTQTIAQTLVWNFDETGTLTNAIDSSGNNNHGTISGNVVSDGAGGYSGFTSTGSRVSWTWSGGNSFGQKNTTLAMWIKNPGDGGTSGHVTLAGAGRVGTSDRSWELWLGAPDVNGNRTLNLSWGHWGASGGYVTYSTPVSFTGNEFYYLAFTWERSNQASNAYPFNFSVYLAKDGASSLGDAIFTGSAGSELTTPRPGPANSDTFYVGGNVAGWGNFSTVANFKGGYFGGSIGSVSLWHDQPVLSASQLNEHFLLTSSIPEPATIALIVGLICLSISILRKKRL